jgi:nucleotide-binding universal stress UspA family protein
MAMPGIIVGIDGSDHSRYALEWAVKEAAIRHAPLTLLLGSVSSQVTHHAQCPVVLIPSVDRS